MLRRLAAVLVCLPFASVFAPTVAAGGGCTEVTQGKGTTLELRVDPHTRVTFVNRDDADHVIVGSGFAWGSDGMMHAGDSFTVRFNRSGVYPFQCYLHPGMAGAVIVGDASGNGPAAAGSLVVEPVSITTPSSSGSTVERTSPLGAGDGTTFGWIGAGLAGIVAGAAAALALVLVARRRRPIAE